MKLSLLSALLAATIAASSWASIDAPVMMKEAVFPGRVSRLNREARLIRIRVEGKNSKFLNKRDRIEFWGEMSPSRRCAARVEGRGAEYVLLSVPEWDACVRSVHLAVGGYLLFWGRDLENNIKTARELVEVLLKKRMATLAVKTRRQRELDGHVEKVEAVNKRYEVLRQKLEAEWHRELGDLEEDRSRSYVFFKQAEGRLNEIESKLEAYRVHDDNFTLDRWSLDPELYIKK